MVTYDIGAEPYRHWVLTIEPPIATLTARGADNAGRADIELSDALQRVRFEHPEVTVVEVAGAPARNCTEIRLAPAGSTKRGPESEAVGLGPLWQQEFEGAVSPVPTCAWSSTSPPVPRRWGPGRGFEALDISGGRLFLCSSSLDMLLVCFGVNSVYTDPLRVVAGGGDLVVAERVDQLIGLSGVLAHIPAVAVMEVTEGKIRVWGDYLDPGALQTLAARQRTSR